MRLPHSPECQRLKPHCIKTTYGAAEVEDPGPAGAAHAHSYGIELLT